MNTPHNKSARTGKFASHVLPRLSIVESWRRRGLTEAEIAANLGISCRSLNTYRRQHRALLQVLKRGKADADACVETALYRLATGYRYEEIEATEQVRTADGRVGLVRRIVRHRPPNLKAIISYLKRQCPQRWNERTPHAPVDRDMSLARVVIVSPTAEARCMFMPSNDFDSSPTGPEEASQGRD